jgi:hypothetical protein
MTASAYREIVAVHREAIADHRKTVIPSEASRCLFFRVRSCERVGLRSEESLFDLSAHPGRNAASPRFFSELSDLCALGALCVNVFSRFSPTTHYSLLTTHWPAA